MGAALLLHRRCCRGLCELRLLTIKSTTCQRSYHLLSHYNTVLNNDYPQPDDASQHEACISIIRVSVELFVYDLSLRTPETRMRPLLEFSLAQNMHASWYMSASSLVTQTSSEELL